MGRRREPEALYTLRWLLFIIICCVLFWALLLIFALSPHMAHGATLTYTVPTQGQYRWSDPSLGADSIMVECSGSDSVQVDSTILVGQPITGGGFLRIRAHYVRGSEGLPDTFEVAPGNYYVLAKNGAGTSCAGNVAYVPPSDPTGVQVEAYDGVVSVRLFDVRGRLVMGKAAPGIYFERRVYRSGKVVTKRVVVLR